MKQRATALWTESLKEGIGKVTTGSQALHEVPYTFLSGFDEGRQEGQSNPEELIAAAHATCFNLCLSKLLTRSGHIPEMLNTSVTLKLDKKQDELTLTESHLSLHARVKEITKSDFEAYAREAEKNCLVSKMLQMHTTLDINFEEN